MATESPPLTGEKTEHIHAGVLPPYTVGDLPLPPARGWRRWLSVIGPGVLLAGASIGSGEWLTGPAVTAQYGATLLWLATLSIIGQVFVNLEMLRYTVYCGEPIVVGYFRSWPGPRLWTWCYGGIDLASAIWPFNVAGAAVALAAALLGHLPGPAPVYLIGLQMTEAGLVKFLSFVLFLAAFVPLIFGGTIYKMLLRIFTFKLAVVLIYLTVFAVLTVSAANAWDICTGFFRFGKVPLRADIVVADRHFSIKEVDGSITYVLKGTFGDPPPDGGQVPVEFIELSVVEGRNKQGYTSEEKVPVELRPRWRNLSARALDLSKPRRFYTEAGPGDNRVAVQGVIRPDGTWQPELITVTDTTGSHSYTRLEEVLESAAERARELVVYQGVEQVGMFSYWWQHGRLPGLDWMLLATLAAIAGAGGLSNTLYSSFARDKGWGMGSRVGAIPSLVGGLTIRLSHVGEALRLDETNRSRWRGWMRYIVEDQIVVWMLCQFIGMALPCMLSLEFIRHAPVAGERVAAMTAEGMAHRYPALGAFLFFLTLFIAFLILYPGQILSGDQLARRWTDIIWSSNPQAQRLQGNQVKYVYYGILLLYALWGCVTLSLFNPLIILTIGGSLMNVAMAFSAFHTLYVNRTLLPKELQPNWFMQLGVIFCGVFFSGITVIVLLSLWHGP